jgi:hypothetical protein
MQMFKLSHATQWIGVVTMSALLLWATAGVQVVSQQAQMPTRSQIVQGLGAKLATLTASEGDILDVENTAFYSDPGVLSAAFIPLHPSSRSIQLVFKLIEGEEVGPVPFGILYLEGDWPDPDLPLKAGIYTLKLRSDRSIVAVAENEEIQIYSGYWEAKPAPVFQTPVPPIIQFSFIYQPEQASIPGITTLDSLNLVSAAILISLAIFGGAVFVAAAICACRK